MQGAITTADRRLAVLEGRLEELDLSSDDDDSDDSDEADDKTEVLRQLEAELNAVKVSHKLLQALLVKTREEAVAKATMNQSGATTVTFGTNNSGLQAGVIHGGVNGVTFGRK